MRYRPEIDGLRAVAVLPVILFHAGIRGFGGGFIGVDVFFVISGYLITSILLSDLRSDRFSILKFYERRARRILPALFFVILCCLPAAWVLMLPWQVQEFAHSIVAVILFVSNIFFWAKVDYFDDMAAETPLLHTWSLSVEEQFYLLFPILLWFLWRFGSKRSIYVLIVISAISLGFSQWFSRVDPSGNFFLLPSRIWELLVGSLCAMALARREPWSNSALSLFGLILVLFSMAWFSEKTPIPALPATLPVAGVALIILFAGAGTVTRRLLSLPLCVGIGLISYSAYLWHQPLFAFARIARLDAPGTAEMCVLIAASLVLAYGTWRFVERPFRLGPQVAIKDRNKVFLASAGAGAALLTLSLTVDNTGYFNATHTPRQIQFLSFTNFAKSPEIVDGYRRSKCFYGGAEDSFDTYDKNLCLHPIPSKRNVLLIGDSHGAHLWFGLSTTFPNVNFMQATASGCRPKLPYFGEKRCTDLLKFVFDRFLPDHPVDEIILSARWAEGDLADLPATLDYLSHYAKRITVFGPTVEYRIGLPFILGSLDDNQDLGKAASKYADPRKFELDRKMKTVIENKGDRYIDTISVLCPDRICRVVGNRGQPMSFDYAHFTLDGSQTLISLLKDHHLIGF